HRDAANVRPIFYAQAWAFAAYLISRSESDTIEPQSLVARMKTVDRGRLDEVTAFAGTEPVLRRVNVEKAAPVAAVSSALSEAAANALLGDLLYRQRNPRAEVFLKRAIELDPKLAAAYVTLGRIRVRERKFAEAKAFLERAIALDSRSHLAYFAHAYLLLRENLDAAAMLRPLESAVFARIRESQMRSIALSANFAESHYLLATVEFSSG